MLKVRTMRGFVKQRLAAAAEEIFELFERTVAEYEEELCRVKRSHRKHLDAIFHPEVRLHRADLQHLLGTQFPPVSSNNLDQEVSPEVKNIKEEEGELWTNLDGEQLQELEEADIIKFTFTHDCYKCEKVEEEKLQSSKFQQPQAEDNRDPDCFKTEATGEVCAGSEPHHLQQVTQEKSSLSDCETDDSGCDWKTSKPQSHLNSLHNNEELEGNRESNDKNKTVAARFGHKEQLLKQTGIQKGGKPLSCTVCGKRYPNKIALTKHMKRHSELKCLNCPVCKKSFPWRGELVRHMRVHTGEKPFSCPACELSFSQRSHLTSHLRVHTGEKPFNCSICKKSFRIRNNLAIHMRVHTGQKPYNCSVCGRRFARYGGMTRHMTVHTREKAFNCSICGERFGYYVNLKRHLTVHTGEKAYSCSVCHRKFARSQYVKKHKCVVGSSDDK